MEESRAHESKLTCLQSDRGEKFDDDSRGRNELGFVWVDYDGQHSLPYLSGAMQSSQTRVIMFSPA